MTEQERLHIRAELARAMGYSVIKDGSYFYLLDRHGSREENADGYAIGSTCEAEAWMNAPNPFTNAADNRALVEWLAADDERWFVFIRKLIGLIAWPEQSLQDMTDATFAKCLREVKYLMTAPLDTITLAAAKALGIQGAGERD